MDSFWRSLATVNPSTRHIPFKPRPSALRDLAITLACSYLVDITGKEVLYPSLGAHLGVGATFSVERKEARGQKLVAIKHIRKDDNSNEARDSRYAEQTRMALEAVLVEVQVLVHLGTLDPKNIVEILAYGWDEGPLPYLVQEYADLGTLNLFLAEKNQLWEQKARISIGIASGLDLMHSCDIIHGDVKLENILVFSDPQNGFEAKLADFGFCCSENIGQRKFRGTRVYNAPEIRNQDIEDGQAAEVADYTKADVYAFGLVLWEIANNGRRYYTVPGIGIQPDDEQVDLASAFLAHLDSNVLEITPYALAFLDGLDIPRQIFQAMSSALQMTLARDPEVRADILDVRLELDPSNESEEAVALPLYAPQYSIFDISTAALPWDVRTELAKSCLDDIDNVKNEYRGLDAFNLAAFHAIGYGVALDEDLALSWLERSASYGHLPAAVLCEAYRTTGLSHESINRVAETEYAQFWDDLGPHLLSIEPKKRFSVQLRSFYRFQNTMSAHAPISISFGDNTIHVEDQQQLPHLLSHHSVEAIGAAWVDVHLSGKVTSKPLIHHLVTAQPDLAETLLREGVDGSEIQDGNLSLLHTACAAGSRNVILTILELYPQLARVCTGYGVCPFHWLFMLEDDSMLEVAQALLRAKADIQRVGVVFLEEFNLVFSGSPLHWAIMARSLPAAESLLACGADAGTESPMPTAECNSYSGFPIDVAACMFMPELVELLLRFGAALDAREDETRTVLHFIGDTVDPFRLWLYHGALLSEAVAETIDLLLRSGADLNFESEDEPTPLSWIVTRSTCTVSVLEGLLSFGPACSEDTIRITAESLQHDHTNARKMAVVLDFCSSHLSREEYVNGCIQALHCLVRDGTVAAAREVLSRFEVTDLRVIDDLELLHQAARNDQVEMLELLLEFDATLDLDKTGTAASIAASLSNQKSLDYLLRRGASLLRHPSRDVSATLLHDIVSSDASLYKSEELLEYIYVTEEHRSRLSSLVNNFDGKGFTALQEAIIWGSLTNIARLLEMGADDRCVRDTYISPTALALLAKTHTPWVIKQQGKPGIVQHQKNMDEIITYLTDSMRFSEPQAVEHCDKIVKYLNQPSPYFEQSNQGADWYMRKNFSPGIEKATALVESWLRRRGHEE